MCSFQQQYKSRLQTVPTLLLPTRGELAEVSPKCDEHAATEGTLKNLSSYRFETVTQKFQDADLKPTAFKDKLIQKKKKKFLLQDVSCLLFSTASGFTKNEIERVLLQRERLESIAVLA